MREDQSCVPTAGGSNPADPDKSQCTPVSDDPDNYIKIDLNGKGMDYDECYYAEMQNVSTEGCRNNVLVYRFEAPENVITDLMKDHPVFKDYKQGMIVYVSSILSVYGPTSNNGKIYEQLRNGGGKLGIYDAESWANKSYFRGYYDNPVSFDSAEYPLRKIYKTTGGTQISLAEVGKYKAHDTTASVPIDATVTYNGKTYMLACSYIKRTADNTPVDCNTSGDSPYWVRDSSPTFFSRNPSMAIGGTDVIALYKIADCDCVQSAVIPNKSSVEGEVTGSVIGKQVPMQVNLQQSETELENWRQWVKGKTNFKMVVRLWRSDNTVVTPLSNTGAGAIWTKVGNAPTPTTDSNPTFEMSLSSASLMAYLDGGTKAIYNDDLTNYAIAAGNKVSFRYNASVTIKADSDGTTISKSCVGAPSTTTTWWRKAEPIPDVADFASVPKYWSEIKEGSPQTSGTGSNEAFDAMSGTPTTRNLYFASGGSEFIVDIQVQYVPQVTQSRTYKSYFTSVVNGWAMSPITGSTCHDCTPSAPTARTMTDSAGASYTESVSLKSEKHITKAAVPCSGNPCTGGSPEESHTDYWYVQEGYDFHTVGGYEDTWTQTVTFDYMKMNKAVVWKIDRSKVNGMTTLVGTNEVEATITQGDPNLFYNIAASNTSTAGRLRYSLETDQHDSVVWNEGSSDNALSNSKTGPVKEQQKFDQRRAMTTNVTAVSDFLILQTSSGDQSVMYFDKVSNTAKTTDQLDVPTTDFATMWTNNSLSAVNWNVRDTIKVGSYNGQYSNPAMKYSGGSTGTVATVFESKPAGLSRPSRPAPYMRLMRTGLDVPDTLRNGEYQTGESTVFYKLMLNRNSSSLPVTYSTASDSLYGDTGQSFDSTYSPVHGKINDVVIHDPVSVEDAMVISLPNSLDQRTPASKAVGGNLQEGVAEYERIINPDYRQNILPNGDAEIINLDATVAGWNTWVRTGSGSNISFTSRTGDMWVITGAHTFEVNTQANSATTGGYWKDIPVKPNTNYRFEADMSCHRCQGFFSLDLYSSNYQWQAGGFGSSDINNSSGVQHKMIDFTTTANTSYVRIHMIKGNNLDAVSNSRDYLFVDNMNLANRDVQEFIAVEGVYVTTQVPNPDYKAATSGTSQVFDYTGGQQSFTALSAGTFTLELWGAAGGYYDVEYGKGGYAKGDVTLEAGDTINLYIGGKGGNSTSSIDGSDSYNSNGGWNGGGSGVGSAGPGGGGGTDIRQGGSAIDNRIIIAGGGGGSSVSSTISYGGLSASTSTLFQGQNGDTSRHSSSFPNDEGGGGGGYYGGMVVHGDDPRSSYGGSSWTGSLPNASMVAGNASLPAPGGGTETGHSGDGAIRITSPPQAAEGNPTMTVQTLAGGSSTSIPSEAYMLVPKQLDPMTPAGGYTPGNFVLLDYGFQLYFPNSGDFYGNGQWGWSSTTEIRGKGFVNDMNTTEWTQAKYVKFDINVIYDGVLYKSNEWISLSVPQTMFDFYVPLANREKVSALVEFKSIAINAPSEDNDTPTNRIRYDNNTRRYAAKHSTLKRYNIDVVGRIGNMVIEDTGDFRFSNLFKQPLSPTEWFVTNVVKRVNHNLQNKIVGDTIDIRGQEVSAGTRYLNTYGLLSHMQQDPITFPLSPEKNNIASLRKQPLRLGYNVLTDLQTIGNYYSNVQVTPYYYHMNLQNGVITPVDIYMVVDSKYKPINKFGAAVPGWNPSSVYSNPVKLDWDSEAGRRNVSAAESEWTDRVANLFAESGGNSATGKAAQPHGNYLYGTSQMMYLTGRNRTYIGQDNTYGLDKNPGNKLSDMEYVMQAQRWHFTYILPSSAVAVQQGQPATQTNINALRTNTGVILMAADILSIGDTYALQYKAPSGNGTINIAGTSWPATSIPYPIMAVYSSSKSSADDLNVSGTH